MKSIDEDIKQGQLKNVYLLHGEERYLLLQYRDKIIDAFGLRDDTMNFSRYEGDGITTGALIDLAETMPFFSDHRLILLEDSAVYHNAEDVLCDYIGQIPDTACLLFCEKKIDKRSRLYKAISKHGRAVEFSRLDAKLLQRWVGSRLGKEQKSITNEAYETFISRVGSDMALITCELEKLISYVGERNEITKEDILLLTSPQIEDKVFDMIAAVSSHNQKTAMQLYFDLLALKVAPVKILVLIARHYRLLLDISAMLAKRISDNEIMSALNIYRTYYRGYKEQARQYSLSELAKILKEVADLDYAFKTGNLNEQLAVELFILNYSRQK